MNRLPFILIIFGACTSDAPVDKFYQPFSPTTIQVTFLFEPPKTLKVGAHANTIVPNGVSQSQSFYVSAPGSFFLNLEIDRPTKGVVSLGPNEYNVFIFPNDTAKVIVNSIDSFDLSFDGTSAEINNYLLEKKRALRYTEPRFVFHQALGNLKTFDRAKEFVDSVVSNELSFLKRNSPSHSLPKWFQEYETAESVYLGAGYKTNFPIINKNFGAVEGELPSDYFDFLKNISINNEKALLSMFYFMFLSEYFSKDRQSEETAGLSIHERVSKRTEHNLFSSAKVLTGRVKELYEHYEFSNLARFLKDSVAVDSAAKEFGIDPSAIIRIAGSNSSLITKVKLPKKGDTIQNFNVVDRLDTLISIRDFQSKIIFINFWATWCGPCFKDFPEINRLVDLYKNQPNVVFLNVCMESDKDKWLNALDYHDIKGVNVFAEGNWNNLIKSYFGIKGFPHHAILSKKNIVHQNVAGIRAEAIDSVLSVKK